MIESVIMLVWGIVLAALFISSAWWWFTLDTDLNLGPGQWLNGLSFLCVAAWLIAVAFGWRKSVPKAVLIGWIIIQAAGLFFMFRAIEPQ